MLKFMLNRRKTMRENKKSFSFIFLAIISILFALSALFFSIPHTSAEIEEKFGFTDTSSYDYQVKVTPIKTDGSPTSGGTVDFNGGTNNGHKLSWQEIKGFNVTLGNVINPPEKDILDQMYHYSIRVHYLNTYISDAKEFESTEIQVKTIVEDNTIENLSLFEQEHFSVEIGSANVDGVDWRGWGIYRFEIEFSYRNSQGNTFTKEAYSDYYGLDPTNYLSKLSIDFTKESSKSDLSAAYNFFIEESGIEDLKYIDVDTIKWYVKGEGSDGIKYVLTDEDLSKFTDYEQSLWGNQVRPRTGKTFYFDGRGKLAKWQVYCEIIPHGIISDLDLTSNVCEVQTGRSMNVLNIIWFIIGGAVLLTGIIVIIIVVVKKKEKVW